MKHWQEDNVERGTGGLGMECDGYFGTRKSRAEAREVLVEALAWLDAQP